MSRSLPRLKSPRAPKCPSGFDCGRDEPGSSTRNATLRPPDNWPAPMDTCNYSVDTPCRFKNFLPIKTCLRILISCSSITARRGSLWLETFGTEPTKRAKMLPTRMEPRRPNPHHRHLSRRLSKWFCVWINNWPIKIMITLETAWINSSTCSSTRKTNSSNHMSMIMNYNRHAEPMPSEKLRPDHALGNGALTLPPRFLSSITWNYRPDACKDNSTNIPNELPIVFDHSYHPARKWPILASLD
mmetsp:Transcript_15262/g.33416  ORF Transcript_15262/g.33416 Transcript_15262/m.33416 type:complete len:243 (-) Transcript_15262:2341-3069(-)